MLALSPGDLLPPAVMMNSSATQDTGSIHWKGSVYKGSYSTVYVSA